MTRLFLWKSRRVLRSIPFYIIEIISLVVAFGFLPSSLGDGAESAGELVLRTANQIASILTLIGGLYAAISITRDVQNRFLSVAIMSGNSSFSILLVQMLSYFAVIFICVFVPSILILLTGCVIFGGEAFVFKAILWAIVYSFVCASAFTIVVPFCFVIKTEGASCIINLIVLIGIWSLIEQLISECGEKVLSIMPLHLFPFMSLFTLCGVEFGGEGFWLQTGIAFPGAVIFMVIVFSMTFVIFKRQEKK